MLIGYLRVSESEDDDQVLIKQRRALLDHGVEPSSLYQDCVSGRKADRPGLESCLNSLRSGDTLVVWKLDRLGRDLRHLVTIIDDFGKRCIGLKVLTGMSAQIDPSTDDGRLIFRMFATLADYERALVIERTYPGLKAVRARGRVGGRPRKMDASTIKIAAAAMSNPKAVARDVAKQLKISTVTLYTYVNPDGTLKDAALTLG